MAEEKIPEAFDDTAGDIDTTQRHFLAGTMAPKGGGTLAALMVFRMMATVVCSTVCAATRDVSRPSAARA